MMPVIIVRPTPGCAATLAAARGAGLSAQGFPLFTVRPLGWTPPEPGSFDALLLGSANAVRHAGPALDRYRAKPAYVVGEQTARAARAAGLAVAAVGGGGLQRLLDTIGRDHAVTGPRLLRLAGAERVALVPPAGTTIVERVVYASEPIAMPAALAALLARPALVLLHSAEAARHVAIECDRLLLDRAGIALAALGPRIAAAAGGGWAAVMSAARPDDTALLALARAMCERRVT